MPQFVEFNGLILLFQAKSATSATALDIWRGIVKNLKSVVIAVMTSVINLAIVIARRMKLAATIARSEVTWYVIALQKLMFALPAIWRAT